MGSGTENKWIGDNIRRIRKEQGLTQQQLAEKAGVSVHYVSAIERGGQTPSLTTLGRLSRALGIGIALLLEEPADMTLFEQRLSELNNALRVGADHGEVEFLFEVLKSSQQHLRGGGREP